MFLRVNDFHFLNFTLSLILHSADVVHTEVWNEGFTAQCYYNLQALYQAS